MGLIESAAELQRLDSIPQLARLAGQWILAAADAVDEETFLGHALPLLGGHVQADSVVLMRGARGVWRAVWPLKPAAIPPEPLLAETLDQERSQAAPGWLAVPLTSRRGELLCVAGKGPGPAATPECESAAALLSAMLQLVRTQFRDRRRVEWLTAILDVAAQWRQTLDTNELLTRMAEASTQLLAAERASIFLWDRRTKSLVGRPALGVEGGELRISEDTGIVGQVVQTGEPRRVNADEDQGEIDRTVDQKLEFQTRSLLCVPLKNSRGKVIGAFEMINKLVGNFTDDDELALKELAAHASVALDNSQQYESLLKTRNQLADLAAAGVELIGNCPAIEALRSNVERIANTELAILILGENGTGKEVVSKQVHYLSRRRHQPLVAVNCAALTESLLESELFGHEKGAFTDAHESRPGKFELADGGTLFLDEIGDMSLGGQAKLLRVLEEKVVVRVGGSTPIPTDARVIAATNQDLAAMVREKTFREDLYYRLCVFTLELPALRNRGNDIVLLAEHFLEGFCQAARRSPPQLSESARRMLLGHHWPGNVRELRNMMERLAYLTTGDIVEAADLSFTMNPNEDLAPALDLTLALSDATRQFQIDYIRRQIDLAQGNMSAAAEHLGLHRSNLYRKMKQLGMGTGSD